ncbi:MAG: hypothetical protein HYU29_03685 [Chloroflexi bacterium]|nr:hypothetical protein [Chloroflexota bacterium]
MTQYDVEEMGPKTQASTLLVYGEGDQLRRGEQRAREGTKGIVLKIVPYISRIAKFSSRR